MRRYTVLVLAIAAVAGLFGLPAEAARGLLSWLGSAIRTEAASPVSGL